jgi:hypothetical protein
MGGDMRMPGIRTFVVDSCHMICLPRHVLKFKYRCSLADAALAAALPRGLRSERKDDEPTVLACGMRKKEGGMEGQTLSPPLEALRRLGFRTRMLGMTITSSLRALHWALKKTIALRT